MRRVLLLFLSTCAVVAQANLILDATDLARLKGHCETGEAARQWKAELLADAERIAAGTFDIPDTGGGWSHDYVCPDDSFGLEPLSPTEHRCRHCGRIWSGGYYDLSYLRIVHSRNGEHAKTLGLAYALTGDRGYAQKERDLLVAYAAKYPTYALHGNRPSGDRRPQAARMYSQTLSESSGHLGFLAGYDLTRDSGVYSASNADAIENDWFREAVRIISGCKSGRSNWQTWHNAALLSFGYVLHDEALVDRVINGEWGVRQQLRESIRDDGFWYEGAIGYHFYAMRGMLESIEAAYHNGVNLWDDPRLISAFTGPLAFAWPNGEYPALNDVARTDERRYGVFSSPFGELARVAARRTGNEALRYAYSRDTQPSFWQALHTPPDEKPVTAAPARGTSLFDDCILMRKPTTSGIDAALLKFGEHGGGHGHFDKLELLLFANGNYLTVDPGTVLYGLPIHGRWYKSTMAHNTLVVDGAWQAAATGKLLGHGSEPWGQWARAECTEAYDGVRMDRTAVLGEGWLVDVFRVASASEHRYDLSWHFDATAECALPMQPAELSGTVAAYTYFKDVRAATPERPWNVRIRASAGNVRFGGTPGEGTTLYTATAPGFKPSPSLASIIQRRHGKDTVFIHVFDWRLEPVQWTSTQKDGNVKIEMALTFGEQLTLTLPADPAAAPRMR